MKRTIVASVLGIAGCLALAVTSHAQGTVYFQNYASAASAGGTAIDAPVTFASSGTVGSGAVQAGWGVGSEFNADLLYSVNSGSTWTLLTHANSGATSTGPFGYPAAFTFGSTPAGPPNHTSTYTGYFYGGVVTIPGYTSGSIEFQVEAYNGASYAASKGAGLWRGQSAILTMSSIATGTTPTGYMNGLQGFTVSSVPEPTTLAFAGMGVLSLLAMARRKKA